MKLRYSLAAVAGIATALAGLNGVAHAQSVPDTAGPYAVVIEQDPANPEHTLYRPADPAKVTGKIPFVAFGNGGCLNIGNLEARFLAEVASYGYLVTAPGKIEKVPENFGPTNTGGIDVKQSQPGQLRRAIDWAIGRSKAGPWAGYIDVDHIAVMGSSCGGLEAIAAGSDPRIDTVVILNSGTFRGPRPAGPPAPAGAPSRPAFQMPATSADLAKLHTPTLYLIGGPKDIAYNNAEADFADIGGIPLFNANIDTGHAGTLSQPHAGAMGTAAIAWLNWQLKGDQTAGAMFTGKSCGMCTNAAWTVRKKNMD